MTSGPVREIRIALTDPRDVCTRLGLVDGPRSFQRQARGVLVRCPWHQENTPSCSVFLGSDGTLRARCHGCDESGDVLSLIAAVHRLDVRRDFRQVLRYGAELAGIVVSETNSYRPPPPSAPASSPRPTERPRDYPPATQLEQVWHLAGPVANDIEACTMLARRGLDAEAIDDRGLARVLPKEASLPWWASYARQSWVTTGHRLILPVYDALGRMRSIRAWRIEETDAPKRLPPGGHKASGLVLADPFAIAVLIEGKIVEGMHDPLEVVIVEGEPDFLTWATTFSDANEDAPVVLGLTGSGSWSDAVAARIPDGSRVVIRTDHDRAGKKYADEIGRSLAGRCRLERSVPVFAAGVAA